MFSLNSDYLNNQSISIIMISGSLRKLGTYQGKQELLLHKRPELLKTLREVAIIQSAESSNRIEGINVPHERIEKILSNKQPPKNRPEGQVLGYRDVLAKIHSSYNAFKINPETILKMHKDMFKFTDIEGGLWKLRDNTIEERLPSGEWVTRFEPVSAVDTAKTAKSNPLGWGDQRSGENISSPEHLLRILNIIMVSIHHLEIWPHLNKRWNQQRRQNLRKRIMKRRAWNFLIR